jgi:DNA-binding transcriptional MocR family regulator/NAD(P)H-dependent flavin oxidoreductase YrpB (nitropropane dioxygenase family)
VGASVAAKLLTLLEIDAPIIQAPMAGVSTPEMAAAVSNAGTLGSIGVGATTPPRAQQMIAAFRERSRRSLNVNVFCHSPARPDHAREARWLERLRPEFARFGATPPATLNEIYRSFLEDDEMLAVLLLAKPKVVSFHFGVPSRARIAALHDAGIVLLASATSLAEARAIALAGVDAVIAQGYEAGGHRGVFDPTADDDPLGTFALMRVLVREIDLPIIAAGGIMDGAGVAAALRLGAGAAQLGTAFIACDESDALVWRGRAHWFPLDHKHSRPWHFRGPPGWVISRPMRSPGLELDPKKSDPLYKQLFDQIVDRVRTGAFPEGYRLPPSRTLATDIGTHRNTVVRAYADLETAGFVASTVGRGTFVRAMRAPSRLESPPAEGAMPWANLLSTAAEAEPLRRLERAGRPIAGRDVVNLTRMQPSQDLLPADLLRRCCDHVLRTEGARALAYAPPEGLSRLRELIAQDLAISGVPAKADDILVTTGSQQGLDIVARALVNPGDTFLVDPSTYPGAINVLTLAGARLVSVPSDPEGPSPGALARLKSSGAKGLYLMPNCRNPTGDCLSTARRKALIAWSREASIPLIEDDYGADLSLTDARPPPALRALDGDVLHMGTFSKKLVPALRIGFVVAPPALRRTLVAVKHAMDLGTSGLLQHVLAEFLERGYLRAHLAKTLPVYRARRDALDSSLRRHAPPGIHWVTPSRGVVMWIPLPQGVDGEHVFEEARRRGVLVSTGKLFQVDSTLLPGIRLAFCAEPEDRLVEGGKRLGEALRAIVKQKRIGPAGAIVESV